MRRFGFLSVALLACLIATGASRRISNSPGISSEWADRVVANGGPRPSESTTRCMELLRAELLALGTNDLYTLCVFVPDSVIAASTPLIRNKGSDPWTNFNFAQTNLNLDGLKGDSLTKAFDTGLQADNNHAYSNNFLVGISVIVSESNSNRNEVAIGGTSATGVGSQLALAPSNIGRMEWFSGDQGSGFSFLLTNDFVRVGWISANTVTNAGVTNQNIYIASSLEPHRLFASEPMSPAGATVPGSAVTLSAFARKQDGTNNLYSGQRMSAAVVHFPFTETRASNIWWALKNCRECLGGGVGDPVKDYARRLVELGGPVLSVTESNALSGLYRGMADDGLIKKMRTANGFLTNNLFAARTPFIWQAGAQVWTNNNFGETNLSVVGLTGNGTTKSLATGIVPSTLDNGFSATSGGMTTMYRTNSLANQWLFGSGGTTAGRFFGFQISSGLFLFFAWSNSPVNINYQVAPLIYTNSAYLSGNRTAANAIGVYTANNAGGHVLITNSSSAQTSIPNTAPLVSQALNTSAVLSLWSDSTISFQAVHSGLTQTESSNLWIRVRDYRNALGGGVP